MPITGPASYVPTGSSFLSHWKQANDHLPPGAPLLVRLPDKDIAITRAEFLGEHGALMAQQGVVTGCLIDQQLARGDIQLRKVALLARFNQFNINLDANYRGTDFYEVRPNAPSITDGQEAFCRPLLQAVKLWEKLDAGPAPAGATLPLVLPSTGALHGAMTAAGFAAALAALQAAYAMELDAEQILRLARARRNRIQDGMYAIMKAYRENVPGKLAEFPVLVETMPRLTPLPGHTPEPVTASATFIPPDRAKIMYTESKDPALEGYELRGSVGDTYDPEYAVVIATNGPNDPREFLTPYGLNQPGARMAFKVYVFLDTGNESGSKEMVVQRPVAQAA
jgi:hypothetical protein